MFFTLVGRIVAWVVFVLGLVLVLMGYSLIADPAAAAQYLGGRSPGKVVDQGLYAIAFAVVLGVLTDISRSARRGGD